MLHVLFLDTYFRCIVITGTYDYVAFIINKSCNRIRNLQSHVISRQDFVTIFTCILYTLRAFNNRVSWMEDK